MPKRNGRTQALTTKSKRKKAIMTPEVRQTVCDEARALGLTPSEYLRLAIGISSNIRTSLGQDQQLNAKQLLTLIENPLFGVLLRTVTETFLKEKSNNPEGTDKQASLAPTPQPQIQKPEIIVQEPMWDFW